MTELFKSAAYDGDQASLARDNTNIALYKLRNMIFFLNVRQKCMFELTQNMKST